MERFCGGDKAAFGELFERYLPRVRSFLRQMVRNPALAEDLAQSTFLSVVRSKDRDQEGSRLDDLLSSAASSNKAPGSEPGRDPLRAAVFAELEAAPQRSWRGDVLLVIGVCAAALLAVAASMLALGQLEPALLLKRALPLAALLGVSAFCTFAALAPRRAGRQLAGFGVAAVGIVGLVLVRGEGLPSSTAPWVCTLSHLGLGAGPLVLALALLRKAALSPARGALMGLEQSWAHVAIWHLAAWAGLAVVAMLVSRRLVPRSFAP